MSFEDLSPELKCAVANAAENPPYGVSSVDWVAILEKLIPIIVQIIQIFVKTPTPTPTPNPTPTPTPTP